MKERIREFAVQSGLEELLWIGVKGSEDAQAVEKFAELIVRECAKVCETTTEEGQPLHLVSLGYAQRVKQHFGVDQ